MTKTPDDYEDQLARALAALMYARIQRQRQEDDAAKRKKEQTDAPGPATIIPHRPRASKTVGLHVWSPIFLRHSA